MITEIRNKTGGNPEIFNQMLLNGELKEFFGDKKVGLELTLNEIGQIFGISRERVRQIELSAFKKLKHPKIGRNLIAYIQK